VADALAERGSLSGAEVGALIGGGSTPATAAGSAEECGAKAETALDPEVRLLYRDVAAQWRRMARQYEEIESVWLMWFSVEV
jgi:hypothetical protein